MNNKICKMKQNSNNNNNMKKFIIIKLKNLMKKNFLYF